MPLSWWELLLILLVLLLVFGAKRLPEMGRSMGKGMREFKDAVTGMDDKSPPAASPPPAELSSASSTPDDESGSGEKAGEKKPETVS
jgi:sec-independent protein translocase protein TatA